MPSYEPYYNHAIQLLQQLIAIPSFSKDEGGTADCIAAFLQNKNIQTERVGHNIIAQNKYFSPQKNSLLLNSHHDTVKPNKNYTRDPFQPTIENGKLYGLGSNDAGGALVSLLATFLYFYDHKDLPYNIIFIASAEEEISGKNGIELALTLTENIEAAIVGEPTQMQMAVAERGLMVVDCEAKGIAGHAARKEGENALYKAMKDIEWIWSYRFDKISDLLGETTMSVTVIETDNKQHNVVPASCKFVLDVRSNELYTFEEIIELLQKNLKSEVSPRSMRLRSTVIPGEHPLVQAGMSLGRTCYGSPTTSDKALMPFPALKMGPGDSARSHTADEFIYLEEIREGIGLYVEMLKRL
ncbi:MAG: M20 family metallo-hydrolase [Bacteroidetes bacterium]|nr:M20 family metallo-hydrolase [Bacteroidota bacterium]